MRRAERVNVDTIIAEANHKAEIKATLRAANQFISERPSLRGRLDELVAPSTIVEKGTASLTRPARSRIQRWLNEGQTSVIANWLLTDWLAGDPEKKKPEDEVLVKKPENSDIAKVLGRWSSEAGLGDQEAVNALIITGGFMYTGWADRIPSNQRGFAAAKAVEYLLHLDEPKHGKSTTTYSADVFTDIILPVVLLGDRLGEGGLAIFKEAIQKNSPAGNPVDHLRAAVGFKERITSVAELVTKYFK